MARGRWPCDGVSRSVGAEAGRACAPDDGGACEGRSSLRHSCGQATVHAASRRVREACREANAGRYWPVREVDATQPVGNGNHIINKALKSLIYIDFLGARHSHSIVNSRALLRGKARCARPSNRPDTDKSTVALECTSSASLHLISLIKRSLGRSGYEVGIFCTPMTVSTDRSGVWRRYRSSP